MTSLSPIELQGVVPVIPTPFHADESIDFDGLAACVEFAVQCQLCAICLPAYGSEFYKLTELERRQLVECAIEAGAGQIAVIAQSNHPSALCAAALAKQHEEMGADLISFAIPRLFGITPLDMLNYCQCICEAVSVPVLIQDFNPGGTTVSGDFARTLADRCENFRYLKLEEPLMSAKVRAIHETTNSRVGVLEGWGGMYMLDLIPTGICGLMPGLGPADILQRIWQLGTAGQLDEALNIFQVILPQLVFGLQNMELFIWLEKNLLAARNILPESSTYVRRPTWTPDNKSVVYGKQLNQRVIEMAGRLNCHTGK